MKKFLLIIFSLLFLTSCQNPVEEIEEKGTMRAEKAATVQPYHSPISGMTVKTESGVPIDVNLSYGRITSTTYDVVQPIFVRGPYMTKNNRWWGPLLMRPIFIQVKNIDTNSDHYGKKYTVVGKPIISFHQRYDSTDAYCSKSFTLPLRYQITSVRLQVNEDYWDAWFSTLDYIDLAFLGTQDNQAQKKNIPADLRVYYRGYGWWIP